MSDLVPTACVAYTYSRHSVHGAAILETGCGGARTRRGARTMGLGAVVSSLVNRNNHVKHAKVAGTTVTTVLACLQSPASMHKSDLDCILRRAWPDGGPWHLAGACTYTCRGARQGYRG